MDIELQDNLVVDKDYTKKYEASFIYKRNLKSYFIAVKKYGFIGCLKKLIGKK